MRYQKNAKLTILAVLFIVLSLSVVFSFVEGTEDPGDYQARDWMKIDVLHDYGYDGSDVTIAILDSGCINHNYFTSTLSTTLVKYIQVDSNTSVSTTSSWSHNLLDDAANHGTAMAGVALQFAPDADLVFYETYDSDWKEMARLRGKALDHLASNVASYDVDVISLSWGYAEYWYNQILNDEDTAYVIDQIEDALASLISDGVTIFIASGNGFDDELSWPANLAGSTDGIVSIGNVYDTDASRDDETPGDRYNSSNYGGNLSLMAVGSYVYTTNNTQSTWRDSTGTSPATAMAAGITACLIEQYTSVPTGQKPTSISPSFIDDRLCDNARTDYDDYSSTDHGNGIIDPVKSMLNWYDYVNEDVSTYGTVTDFAKLTDGSGSATFQESSSDEYYTWTEGFSSVPPSGWSKTGNWKKKSWGGQSGPYAECKYDEITGGSGYLQSSSHDTSDAEYVYLEFYYKMGLEPGSLTIYVYDEWGNWDSIGTYTYRNYWYKVTWSSTSSQYQHSSFKVKFSAVVDAEDECVNVDSYKVQMRYEDDTYKFLHKFQFTELSYSIYDNATLQFYISSHSGSENLVLQVYDSGWQTLSSSISSGTYSFSVGDYVTSATFEIRFYGASESRDLSQDSWTFDYLRLLVLDDAIGVYS